MTDLVPIDMATHPYLTGRFAPVTEEIEVDQLEVEGTLPEGLVGAYLRNGPNLMYPSLGSYTFPMEGDGMVHGIWFDGEGGARYKNRWVRTKGMAAEIAAGHDVFGGLMTPAFVDPDLLGPDPDPGWPFKLDPFINVVHHAGRLLALSEALPAYQITPELETVGLFDFGGKMTTLTAHPRIDPVTGDMVVFGYDIEAPFLRWAVVGADGEITQGPHVVDGVDDGYMIHDCTITERYLVLVLAPVVFDLDAMAKGGNVLAWRPELGTRIVCIPRDGGPPKWMHTDPFFVWHYGNAYDDGDDVVLDFPWWNGFSLTPDPARRGGFTRARLGPDSGKVELTHLDVVPGEFARIDDRRTGRAHRYVTMSRKTGRPGLLNGEFDRLTRYDMATGESLHIDSDLVFGEVVHAPRAGSVAAEGDAELDGWYVAFATDHDATRSWFVIWDAASFPSEPVARVRMPQRVPNGLHGNWMPGLS